MLNKIDGYLIMSYVTLLCNSGTLKVSIIKERERERCCVVCSRIYSLYQC